MKPDVVSSGQPRRSPVQPPEPGGPGLGPGSGAPGNPSDLHAAREVAGILVGRQGPRRSCRARSHRRCLRDDRSVRGTARASSPARGSIRHTRRGCWPTRRPRWRSSASIVIRAKTSSRSRTPRKSITWSSARCARATRGRSSAFHRCGHSRHRIVRVRSSIPAAC